MSEGVCTARKKNGFRSVLPPPTLTLPRRPKAQTERPGPTLGPGNDGASMPLNFPAQRHPSA